MPREAKPASKQKVKVGPDRAITVPLFSTICFLLYRGGHPPSHMAAALPELVQEAINKGLLPELSSATATGYAGVAEHKANKSKAEPRFQGKWWDAERKKARFAPGLYKSAWQAAMARAHAKQIFEAAKADGEVFPSPRKRKCRAVPATLPCVMATPASEASSRLPLATVVLISTPVAPPSFLPSSEAEYTPPVPSEVSS